MRLAIAILANTNLNRVGQLADILSKQMVNVCIHVDVDADQQMFRQLRSKLRGRANVHFSRRIFCDWGDYSLVEAELQMCTDILKQWPDTSHVQLISGDSLPVRPMHELLAMLTKNEDVDFIESVTVGKDNWITGGLGIERFTLHFPFSWKTQRRRFDTYVNIQRKLGVQRKMPDGMQPYIGSQWWCLTAKTIKAVLNDPMKPTYDAYFRKCWIPDESYFQTLVRKHARKIQSRSLMYSLFDHQGKPTTLYDDHGDFLGGLEEFFVRKIWPGADGLYQRCEKFEFTARSDTTLSGQIQIANGRRKVGRNGLRMQGCAPNNWHESQLVTATPYFVFSGVSAAFSNFDDWLETKTSTHPHGRLYERTSVNFQHDTETGPGGLSSNIKIRDASPDEFLGNLIWQSRETIVAFHFGANDCVEIETFLTRDPNANIYHIEHGWILDLMADNIENQELLRSRATHFLDRERAFLSKMQGNRARCQRNVWTLADVLGNPVRMLSRILLDMDAGGKAVPMILPKIANMDDAIAFARKLKDIGISIDMGKVEDSVVHKRISDRNVVNK